MARLSGMESWQHDGVHKGLHILTAVRVYRLSSASASPFLSNLVRISHREMTTKSSRQTRRKMPQCLVVCLVSGFQSQPFPWPMSGRFRRRSQQGLEPRAWNRNAGVSRANDILRKNCLRTSSNRIRTTQKVTWRRLRHLCHAASRMDTTWKKSSSLPAALPSTC